MTAAIEYRNPTRLSTLLLGHRHEVTLGLLLIGCAVAAGLMEPRFVQPSIQLDLAGEAWAMAFVALPMTMIVITAGIDLSVGSIVGLCAVVFGLTTEAGGSVSLGVLLALMVGTLAGFANASLIAWLRFHPLIVTLATMAGFRGIALALTNGRTLPCDMPGLDHLTRESVFGISLPMWGFLVSALLARVFLRSSIYGRMLYAIGHNEVASRYSGIPVTTIKLAIYTLSGTTAGLAAVLLVARYQQAKADFATGLELEVLAAVVLGGISIFGGRGNIVGLLLGLALLHELVKFVPWHWHISELNSFVTGGLLIGSVLINSVFTRLRGRYYENQ